MVAVNVKEVRKRLRELLDRVSRGEQILVTRRGVPVARLVPPGRDPAGLPDLSDFRKELGEEGTPASRLLREERDER